MNKILEEFNKLKNERNQFINETNKKGELLLSQAKSKFDSVKNSILDKNINNINLEDQYDYIEAIKHHLQKAINLNTELFSYDSFFNNCFQDLVLSLELKMKNILNKNNETIKEEDCEYIQNIIKLAHLTKVLVDENDSVIKGNSNIQKTNLLIQLKENLNIIFTTFSDKALSNKNGKSIIDKISKILNYLSENIIFIYNDINSNNLYYEEGSQYVSYYLLSSIFNQNFNIYNNVSNSKIWKFIITKNNNNEITLSQSNYKFKKNKNNKKISRNYSILIYIEKNCNNINATIKLIKYLLSYIKNVIMKKYVITNNFKSKIEGYYCFEIFGVGKRKKKIIQKIKKIMEKITDKNAYKDICVMVKISSYNELDILMKKKLFNLFKKEFFKINENEENNNFCDLASLVAMTEKDIHYNFDNDMMKEFLNPNFIFEC
jgi:hypothetical protein